MIQRSVFLFCSVLLVCSATRETRTNIPRLEAMKLKYRSSTTLDPRSAPSLEAKHQKQDEQDDSNPSWLVASESIPITVSNRNGARIVEIPDPQPHLQYPASPIKISKANFLLSIVCFTKVYILGILKFGTLLAANTVVSTIFIFAKFWMKDIELRPYMGFMTALNVPPLAELQFDFGRMLSYVPYLLQATQNLFQLRHKMYTADELVGPTVIPSDDQFISQVILRTPMAYYTSNEPTKLVTDMSHLEDVDNFPSTYYDIQKIEIDKATSQITLFSKEKGPISRESCNDIESWDRAKMHAMGSISYFIPGIGHSWVHFHLMDTVSAIVYNQLDRKSILYSLLEPHTRYTNRINWEAIGRHGPIVWGGNALVHMAAEATSALPRGAPTPAIIKKYEPWTPFAITNHEFARAISRRATEYYVRSDEFTCPPKWLDGPNADVPYIKSLKRFYPIVRKHVEKVLSYESNETIEKFIDAVDEASMVDGTCLDLKRFDPIDVVSTVLFKAIFVHSWDHYFYSEILGKARFGIGTIRHPISRTWFPGTRICEDMLDDDDRVRFNGFCNVFVKFNDSKLFSNGMKSLRYKFRYHTKDGVLQQAAEKFVEDIERENVQLKQEGLIFCPMDQLSRSICF